MATYFNKEISEWNTSDLSSWLIDNKYPGISELCQNNSISGYDLFFLNDDILKNELGLSSFHERKVAMKLISKLTYEHLKLNIINSNGDNVILTLDNNLETSLGEISEYIGGMFNIEPKNILYKDSTKKEVLSPTVKIIKLLILYPKLYKTLNVSNMKDYHQMDDEIPESNDVSRNNNTENNANISESNYQDEKDYTYKYNNKSNNLMTDTMRMLKNDNIGKNGSTNNYIANQNNNNIGAKSSKYNEVYQKYDRNFISSVEDGDNVYDNKKSLNNKEIIYNEDYDIKKNYKNEQNNYRANLNDEVDKDNSFEIENNRNDLQFNYRDKRNAMDNKREYNSVRNNRNINYNDNAYQYYNNKNSNKNMGDRGNNYYNNNL